MLVYTENDFEKAIRCLKDPDLYVNYDVLMELASKTVGKELIDEMAEYPFDEAMLAAFSNGILVGILAAENKYEPEEKPPLIEH